MNLGLFRPFLTEYVSRNVKKCRVLKGPPTSDLDISRHFSTILDTSYSVKKGRNRPKFIKKYPKTSLLVSQSYQMIFRLTLVKNTQRYLKLVNSQNSTFLDISRHFSAFLNISRGVDFCREMLKSVVGDLSKLHVCHTTFGNYTLKLIIPYGIVVKVAQVF